MIQRTLLILSFVLLFTMCKKNEYLIPQDQLIEVLVHLHMADAIMQTNMRDYVSAAQKDDVIISVLEKHGIEEEKFDSTMHYYALNSPAFAIIYERVMEEILLLESKVNAGEFDKSELYEARLLVNDQFPQDSMLIDSILREIWWEGREIFLPEDGAKDRGSFEKRYDDTAKFKALLLMADVHVFYDDCSLNPQMTLRANYSNDSVNKKQVALIRDSVPRSYSIYLPVSDTTRLVSIMGEIIDHDACTSKKHAIVKNIRMYELVDSGHPSTKIPERIISRN